MTHPEILLEAAARPGRYFAEETLHCYEAFIADFNLAQGGAPLLGYREFTIVKAGKGNNLAFGDAHELITGETELERIRSFAELISEFFEERSRTGPRPILVRYQQWLERQPWCQATEHDFSKRPMG